MTPAEAKLAAGTALLTWLGAESVCGKAAHWLDSDAPRQFASLLSARAARLYSANPTFARRLRATGNEGRECLQSFMRHWLAARLARQRPALFRQLPPAFSLGASPAVKEPASHQQRLVRRSAGIAGYGSLLTLID